MKKLILTLVVAMTLFGGVYGSAAGLTLDGADDLGSNIDIVKGPGTASLTVTDVSFNLLGSDTSVVDTVTVGVTNSATSPAETCDIGVNLLRSSQTVVEGTSKIIVASIPENITGSPVETPFTTGTGMNGDAALIDGVEITLACDDQT